MDYNGIIADLILQLVNNGREYLDINKREQINPIIRERLLQHKIGMISSLLKTIKSTKEKSIIK